MGHFYYTLTILPNIAEFILKFILKYFYGYELELLLVGILIYTTNALIVSYYLYKWFVKGEGKVK